MPLVSIGLPVFNGEKYLDESIRSVLGQTFDDFELIISDNASTDATREICLTYAAEDSRISYSRNDRNTGGAPNFNRVFALSSGEYFKWHSHDDVIGDHYLERCLAGFGEDPGIVLCFPRIVYIDEDGASLGGQTIDDLSLPSDNAAERVGRLITLETSSKDIFWAGAFGLSRRAVLAKTQLLGSFNAADQVLIFQLALLGKWAQVDGQLYFRRDHPEASMAANKTPADVLRWFNPEVRKTIILPEWKVFYEHLASVRRAGLSQPNEVRSYYHVARRFLGKEWRNLGGDLKLLTRDFIGRLRMRPGSAAVRDG
jgi:glycosyltransferase involved in cell wall biosynthesis